MTNDPVMGKQSKMTDPDEEPNKFGLNFMYNQSPRHKQR